MNNPRGSMYRSAGTEPPVNLRQQLAISNYDISLILDSMIGNISGKDQEKQLLGIFTDISNGVTKLSQNLETEMKDLYANVQQSDEVLHEELDTHRTRLNDINVSVDSVIDHFHKASEGALRIGEQLAVSESERLRIDSAIEIMEFVNLFESTDPSTYNDIHSLDTSQLLELFPVQWRNKGWGEISKILHDMKKILFDINADDVQNAQRNVVTLCEAVETELLSEFEIAVLNLMDCSTNDALMKTASDLASWLHLYNNGQSLEKRYIFSVVEKRLPNYSTHSGEKLKRKNKKIYREAVLNKQLRLNKVSGNNLSDDEHDDSEEESEGSEEVESSSEEEDHNRTPHGSPGGHDSPGRGGVGCGSPGDHLSELFGTIIAVCAEQFDIIRKVFPQQTVARVTRLLIQRIFNDPAFGIQTRVENALKPKPPRPPMLLAEYLDALITVKEKLSCLHIVLMDHCVTCTTSYIALQANKGKVLKSTAAKASANTVGVGLTAAAISMINADPANVHKKKEDTEETNINGATATVSDEEYKKISEEHMNVVAEIKEFLEEQISLVLLPYMPDYFEKEILQMKLLYADLVRKAIGNAEHEGHFVNYESSMLILPAGLVHGPGQVIMTTAQAQINNTISNNTMLNRGGSSPLSPNSGTNYPKLRPEKLKSISVIVQSVGHLNLIDNILTISHDVMQRVECIGKDDKRLPDVVKEIAILEMSFVVDGLMVPWQKFCTALLNKFNQLLDSSNSNSMASAMRNLGSQSTEVALPPMELLDTLVTIYSSVSKLKLHFTKVYSQHLKSIPNALAVFKEHRRRLLRSIEGAVQESLVAWISCIASSVEKLLNTLHTKYHYAPRDYMRPAPKDAPPTPACAQVCKVLSMVIAHMEAKGSGMPGLNAVNLFWKPLGIQVVGLLISHIRRQRITDEGGGGEVLVNDMKYYCEIAGKFVSPEVMDQMLCLREITQIFVVPPEQVITMITEEFRHLDTSIVLSLVKARADINTSVPSGNRNKPPLNWYKELVAMYGYFHWEDPLPWEAKKNISNSLFNDNSAGLTNKQESVSTGPSTLRKAVGPINVKVIDAARKRLPELTAYSYYTSDEYMVSSTSASPSRNAPNTRVENTTRSSGMAMNNGNMGTQNSFLVPSNPDTYNSRPGVQSTSRPANGSVYSGYGDDFDASSVNSGNSSRQYGGSGGTISTNTGNTDANSVTSSGTTDTSGSWGSFLSNVASTVTATASTVSSAMGSDTEANRSQARQTPAGRGMQREKSMFMKVSSMFGK